MKKNQIRKFAVIISISLWAVSPAAAIAVTDTTAANTNPPATTTTTDTQAMATRIELRKTALKTKLDSVTQKKIVSKCKAAQVLITASKDKSQSNIDGRYETYFDITSKLSNYIDKLKKQSVDTKEIEAIQSQFATKTAQYKTDRESYIQILGDLTSLDCATDPVGFKATLDSLRLQRAQLLKDANDIKSQRDQLIKALGTIRLALVNKQTNSTTQGAN